MSRARDSFKTVAKEAAKRAVKSFLRYLVATFGLPAVAIMAAVILVLVTIYAVLPASGIPGSKMDTCDKVKTYYQGVVDKVNPPLKASKYQEFEKSHLLTFGIVYSVDFFANNLTGEESYKSEADEIAKDLKPVFSYIYKVKKITVIITGKQGTTKTVTTVPLTFLNRRGDLASARFVNSKL